MATTRDRDRHGDCQRVLDLSHDRGRRRRRPQPRGAAPVPAAAADRRGSALPAAFLWYRILDGRPVQPVPAAARRPAGAHPRAVLRRADPAARPAQFVVTGRSPHSDPAGADRRPAGRRRRHRRRQGRGRPVAATCSWPTAASPARWAAGRAAACCSRAARAPARPTRPRRWRPRPACRSCSPPRRRSSRATRAPPAARSASSSRRCARRLASTAARSASSRSSTRSPGPRTARPMTAGAGRRVDACWAAAASRACR